MMYLIKGYYPAYVRDSNSSTEKQIMIFKVNKGTGYFGFFKRIYTMAFTYKAECSSPVIIREIQNKQRLHLTSYRMAIIKRMGGSKYWQGHKE